MAIFLTNRDGGKTDEEGHYRYLSAGFTGNVLDGFNVTQNTPLGMSIAVNPGNAKVPYGGYSYSTWIAPSDKEVATIPTASASNPRIDRIVLYVDRTVTPQTTTPNNPGIPKIAVVSGTPGAVPVRPSNSAVNTAVSNNPWIDLADVRVNTGVTQITNANITDTRIMASAVLANGAVTPNKRSGGFKIGIIPGSTLGTTGVKQITGIGFKPKSVSFTVLPPSATTTFTTGSGSMTEASQFATSSSGNNSSSGRLSYTNSAILSLNFTGASVLLRANYVSMDSDGFSIDVINASSSLDVAYEAYA